MEEYPKLENKSENFEYSKIDPSDPVVIDQMVEIINAVKDEQGVLVLSFNDPIVSIGAKTSENKLVGTIQVSEDGHVNYIVHPQYQRKGIASNMLTRAIEAAKTQGLHNLIASVESGSHSEKLLKKTGFSELLGEEKLNSIQNNKIYSLDI